MRISAGIAAILVTTACPADGAGYGGHAKINVAAEAYPGDSLLRDALGSESYALQGDVRLNVEWRERGWSADVHYQLVGLSSDRLAVAGGVPGAPLPASELVNDDRRLMDLTSVIHESGNDALLHRLDRAWIGYSGDSTVARFGRQALTWGNAFFYAPMDLVNPFDPAAIDTEYKAGDDMLYAQYLRGNGDDVQAAIVLRRDPSSGEAETHQSTAAVKYHGFASVLEYDLLVADTYGDTVLGLGVSRAVGGAVWSADVVATDAGDEAYLQLVTNLSYSWTFAGRNVSGVVEYHYSGVGQRAGRYSPAELAGNPDLLGRLATRRSFTLGRHYLAASVTVEMTPLWRLTPLLLANVADPSALLQLTSSFSLADNTALLGNVSLPIGANDTEFGGIGTGVADRFLSRGAGVFVQFAWYF